MTQFKSEFLNTLSERGFIHQISDPDGLDKKFSTEIVTGYIGYDPTAASLHVGHLMQIMMLHWMQKTGHRPIALMGGGTGMIGDPSFKDEARKLLTVEGISANIDGIKQKFANFLDFGDGPQPIGCLSLATSNSCVMSAVISRSTGCSASIPSSCVWIANSR